MLNLSKQNFYEGQSIAPKELNDLQEYSDINNNYLVSSVIGYGVIEGFDCSIVNNHLFKITAGKAFNNDGSTLVLESDKEIDISHLSFDNESILHLGIKRDYTYSDITQDIFGETVYKKLTPTIECILGSEIDEETLYIAEITVNASGIISITDTKKYLRPVQELDYKTSALTTTQNDATIQSPILNLISDNININNNTLKNTIIDIIYPLGCTYTQYPKKTVDAPGSYPIFVPEESPAILFGGIWELQFNDKGVFFRTEGGFATHERYDDTGIQGDALRRLLGSFNSDGMGFELINTDGIFRTNLHITNRAISGGVVNNTSRCGAAVLDSEGFIPTSNENRPINMLKRIWKRVA